jgi:dTDP-4-amino-4,6-dideoxygalactose transaminase
MILNQQLVPFNDLKAQYLTLRSEILPAIEKVLDDCAYILGPAVQDFEKKFADAHEVPYCLAVNSGTAALHLALMAMDLKHGDEIILPTNTFFATAEAVSLTGATPIFVDCLPDTCNIDPSAVESAITSSTRAVIAVHLYGQPAEMEQLQAITKKHGISLLEDCAQAHLARYNNQAVGGIGLIGCFSFYPGKNLGAYGEGGAVVTHNQSLYEKMKALRDHGASQKYHHDYVGHNYRMDGIQGAILGVKIGYLSQWTEARKQVAEWYHEQLAGLNPSPVRLLTILPNVESVHHLYVVRVQERDELMQFLNERGIQTGIHYPIPCHLQKAYQDLNYRDGSLPVSESAALELLSLPIYPEMTESQVTYVCDVIKEFYKSGAA